MDFTGWVLANILVTLCNFLCSPNYCPDLFGVTWYNWFWVAMNDSGWWERPISSPIEGHSMHHYQLNEFVLEILALLAPTFHFRIMQMSQYASLKHWLELCQLQDLCQLSMTFGSWCSHRWQARRGSKIGCGERWIVSSSTFVSSSEDRPGDCLIKNLSCTSNIPR
jgi:hypothetical protein